MSVRPFVCHAPVLYQNEESYSVMISSPSGSTTIQFSDAKFHHQIRKRSPRAEVTNKGKVGKISIFLCLSVNILKTVADTAKVTMTNSRAHTGFPWTPRSMTLDDLELL